MGRRLWGYSSLMNHGFTMRCTYMGWDIYAWPIILLSFNLSHGEMSIKLDDVSEQVDGDDEQVMRHRSYAFKTCLLHLVSTSIFVDKSFYYIDMVYLRYFTNLERIHEYNCEAACLIYLYSKLAEGFLSRPDRWQLDAFTCTIFKHGAFRTSHVSAASHMWMASVRIYCVPSHSSRSGEISQLSSLECIFTVKQHMI